MRTAADGAERTQARPAAPLFVEFADGRFELDADGRSRLSIELADVTAVGEFTNAAGPWADDYFMVLRYRTAGGEEELEVPFNENSGARDAYAGLLAALGAPRTFCLVNCTHPASVFLWPPDRAGTPVWPDYGPARSLGTDRDYARWRKERRRSRDTRPQPAWRGADPATPCTMNRFLVKLQNDRIFREGSFPEMRSEYIADIVAVPVARTTEFRVRDHLLRTNA